MENDFFTEMNPNDNIPAQYQGNGWSKYQVYVLRQLDDHNKVLEKLNNRLSELNEKLTVITLKLDADVKEKEQARQTLVTMQKDIDYIFDEKEGYAFRFSVLEDEKKIEQAVSARTKVWWTTIGGVIVVILSFLGQIAEHLINWLKSL